jgi:hypothetical protein
VTRQDLVKNRVVTRCLFFFTKMMSFWLKKKNWPGRPDDLIKTRNPGLGPEWPLGRVWKLWLKGINPIKEIYIDLLNYNKICDRFQLESF